MPPRKRTKGRARKKKQASAPSKKNDDSQQQHRRRQPQGQQALNKELEHLIVKLTLEENSNCTHGRPPFPPLPANDICHNFIREYVIALHRAMHAGLLSIPNGVSHVYNFVVNSINEKKLAILLTMVHYKEKLSASLISLGTNYLLQGTDVSQYFACVVGMFILYIESEEGPVRSPELMASMSPELAAKMRDLCADKKRATTQFFRKRIKCACLTGKYKQAKSEPKHGLCFHCNHSKERKELLLCTGCNVAQYCSEECQLAHWPEHKDYCMRAKSKFQSDGCIIS